MRRFLALLFHLALSLFLVAHPYLGNPTMTGSLLPLSFYSDLVSTSSSTNLALST